MIDLRKQSETYDHDFEKEKLEEMEYDNRYSALEAKRLDELLKYFDMYTIKDEDSLTKYIDGEMDNEFNYHDKVGLLLERHEKFVPGLRKLLIECIMDQGLDNK